MLKIDQKTNIQPRGSKVIHALSHMLIAEPFNAFQLNSHNVLNEDIGKVIANILALVHDGHRNLSRRPKSARLKLNDQSALINLLKKTAPQSIGNLEGSV